MAFQLGALPYDLKALEPHISQETLRYHYSKHHANYVDTLNKLIANTDYENMKLEEIVVESAGKDGEEHKIFNNAGQVWNHTFFWNCMTPQDSKPSADLMKLIEKAFGSYDHFKEEFVTKGVDLFGSGWLWLVKDHDDQLSFQSLADAGNPLPSGKTPLLVCDVWEHAYYLDYQNERKKYVENFLEVVNWRFVETCYEHLDATPYSKRPAST